MPLHESKPKASIGYGTIRATYWQKLSQIGANLRPQKNVSFKNQAIAWGAPRCENALVCTEGERAQRGVTAPVDENGVVVLPCALNH